MELSSGPPILPRNEACLNVTKRRTRARAAALLDFAGFKSEKAGIQGMPASERLYLNKLLRFGGDASLAILTYHFERASHFVQ